jgi:hypothetical protein
MIELPPLYKDCAGRKNKRFPVPTQIRNAVIKTVVIEPASLSLCCNTPVERSLRGVLRINEFIIMLTEGADFFIIIK